MPGRVWFLVPIPPPLQTHLGERQLLRVGAALADALLDDAHGESPVGNAGRGVARVAIVRRDVRVDTVEQQLKALGGIAQTAKGEASTCQGAAGQGASQWLRAERGLRAGLQLLEEFLQEDRQRNCREAHGLQTADCRWNYRTIELSMALQMVSLTYNDRIDAAIPL